jgi:hypothetical protein
VELAALIISAVGVAGAVAGLWYGALQLRHTRSSARASFLLDLDSSFAQHVEVHRLLRPGGAWAGTGKGPTTADEWIAVEDYMGLFERIEVLIEGGVLVASLVDRLYGYRVSNIVANPVVRDQKLIAGADGWQDFLMLVDRLREVGRSFPGLPEGAR